MKLLRWIIVALSLSGVAIAQNDGRAMAHIFPHIADGHLRDGSYYRSALHITNPSATASGTCTVVFRGMTTTLQDVKGGVVAAGAFSISFAGNSWGVFRTGGTAPFQSGYATVSCTIPVNAVVIYSYYTANSTKLSEAAVFSSAPGTLLQIVSDQREGARLGIAITNDTDFVAAVTISASGTQGEGIGSTTITLPGRSQSVRFLDELIAELPREHLGQVTVRSSGPPIAIIGIRYTGAAFGTIPSSVRQSSAMELPAITSMTPTSMAAGSTAAVALSGKNFATGATIVSVAGTGITVTGTQVVSATSLSALFTISSSAAAGVRSVTVSTPGGTSSAITFSVTPPSTTPFNQSQTQRLLGTWSFSYTVGASSLSQTYRLSDVQVDASTPGEWVITGRDQFGEVVIGGYSARLGTFALLDTAGAIDRLYAFDFTGVDMVGGCYYQMPAGTTNLSACYSMNGVRTTTSAITEAVGPSSAEQQARLNVEEIRELVAGSQAPAVLLELLENLRNQANGK